MSAAGEQAEQAFNLTIKSVEEPIEKGWASWRRVSMSDLFLSPDSEDYEYGKYSDRYWKTGRLQTIFQKFNDAIFIIESSDISGDNKTIKNAKILEVRKYSFRQHFKDYPPWK